MQDGFFLGATLGRRDNDGDYCKENCRWEHDIQQSRNRRDNRLMVLDGVTKTMVEWSEATGINQRTIATRLFAGWSDRDALTRPVHKEKGWRRK